MSNIDINLNDVKKLETIVNEFSRNVIKNYTQGDALQAFKKELTLKDKFRLISGSTKVNFCGVFSHKKQVKILLKYCSNALTVMKRTFGEDYLARSLPQIAEEQRIIDICKALGANDIADLAIKAKQLRSTPPSGPASANGPQQ